MISLHKSVSPSITNSSSQLSLFLQLQQMASTKKITPRATDSILSAKQSSSPPRFFLCRSPTHQSFLLSTCRILVPILLFIQYPFHIRLPHILYLFTIAHKLTPSVYQAACFYNILSPLDIYGSLCPHPQTSSFLLIIIIYFQNVHFSHVMLGFSHMKSLHTSLNTTHSGCKQSTSISSSTHSFQFFLFLPLHLVPATSTFLQADT